MLSERNRGSLSETRKITKSAMEKKRRARINTSLIELKTILGGMLSTKTERFDKLEKADILEMTVRYVKQLQRKSDQLSSPAKNKDEDYKSGVNSCISEVIKYIASSHSCDENIKAKLLDHLANRLTGVEEPAEKHECDTTINSCVDHEPSTPEVTQDVDLNISEDNAVPTRVSISLPHVCSTAATLSPGSNYNQINFQGQCAVTSLQTSPIMTTFQQGPSMVSNIPLTILVPANFYPSVSGTTCVFPLSIPTSAATPMAAIKPASGGQLLNNVSPVIIQHNTSLRNVSDDQQNVHCSNGMGTKSISGTISILGDKHGNVTNKPCNIEKQNILKENFVFQPYQCLTVPHSPVLNSVRKEQIVSEQLWRPW